MAKTTLIIYTIVFLLLTGCSVPIRNETKYFCNLMKESNTFENDTIVYDGTFCVIGDKSKPATYLITCKDGFTYMNIIVHSYNQTLNFDNNGPCSVNNIP